MHNLGLQLVHVVALAGDGMIMTQQMQTAMNQEQDNLGLQRSGSQLGLTLGGLVRSLLQARGVTFYALGLRMLIARARYLRATALRLSNDPEATRDYAAALRLLDELKGEDGNQNVMKRADLFVMYAECQRWSKPA